MASNSEEPSLASLSLADDKFQVTLPGKIQHWIADRLNWKEREEQMAKNLMQEEDRLAQALERTMKRWRWFEVARETDKDRHTSFGTLGYLPLEVRFKIYALVLNTQVRRIPKYWGCFSIVPPWRERLMYQKSRPMWWMQFENQACAFGCWNDKEDNPLTHHIDHPGPLNLRTYFAQVGCRAEVLRTPFLPVSRSLRDEFGNWMAGSRNFEFSCPASFEEFLHNLSPSQIASLRRITIDLTGPAYAKGCIEKVPNPACWASVFEKLPSELASLRHITIWIGKDAPSYHYESGKKMVWYQDDMDCVGESLLPFYDTDIVAKTLGIVRKGIHRVAPEADFFIPEFYWLNGGNQGIDWITGDEGSDRKKVTQALVQEGMSARKVLVLPYDAKLSNTPENETKAEED
ncbi:hypothetical protein G7Y79_00032g067530 [Physcia stellaris]|nr:hypothetical protein G7Y79_00032g067530 [Physcia stellaris]